MTNKICKISLFSVILASVINMPADARITVKKTGSYANAYKQVVDTRQQAEYMSINEITATTNSATPTLPVAVDDENLAQDILNNASTKVGAIDLEMCSMIYPRGIFRWGVPESGIRKNPAQQCIAVVELRDANTNTVLAQTTLAAGDAMKCNIDMFPESGWQQALGDVTLPADESPTIAQVEQAMNQEQKQNAGLKIAAAAILSGVAGNMLAPKEAGDTKLLGTSKTQLIDTAISATAGAGIMAASTYTGKVAGDTIKSTAVNAAAGMVVGNMAAGMSGGNGVLYTTKCSIDGFEHDCVVGKARITNETEDKYEYDPNNDKDDVYLVSMDKKLISCTPKSLKNDTEPSEVQCKQLMYRELIKIKISVDGKLTLIENMKDSDWQKTIDYGYKKTEQGTYDPANSSDRDPDTYYIVQEALKGAENDKLAYAVFDSLPKRLTGYKTSDFSALEAEQKPRYFARNSDGSVGSELKADESKTEKLTFTPSERSASDGPLVDLSNEARTKATITGGVAGGALGGFSAYQGAKQEVSERWTAAVRAYDDSLSNFYCATGTRPLAKYNDYFEIPEMQKNE